VFEATFEPDQASSIDEEETIDFGWFDPSEPPENVFGPDRIVLADASSSVGRPFVR
jgi:hypothetical protein